MEQNRKRDNNRKQQIGRRIAAVLAAAVLAVGGICGPVCVNAAEADYNDDFFYPEETPDVEELIKEYGQKFDGADIKLELTGDSTIWLQFLNAIDFNTLELVVDFSDCIAQDEDYNEYRLCDVSGLTKLSIMDDGYGSFSREDVFPTLTDLTVTNTGYYTNIYGCISSRQMPALKNLTLYFGDAYDLYSAGWLEGLQFPETLETITVYFSEEFADPSEINDPKLIGALRYCCPNVLVNGVTVDNLTPQQDGDYPADYQVASAYADSMVRDLIDKANHGNLTTVDGLPRIYGKLMLAWLEYTEGDFYQRQESASPFEKGWFYTAQMTQQEMIAEFGYADEGPVYVDKEVPLEILADSIVDADVLVIIYDNQVPLTAVNDYGEIKYRKDTNVIVVDLNSGSVYAPYTAYSIDPEEEYDFVPAGVDAATEQVLRGYVNGTIAEASAGLLPSAAQVQSLGGEDNEELGYILNALGSQDYIDTLTALQGGETITSGTYSYAAAGLQQTLVDFGCNIAVDGNAGPATFEALNNVLAAFGMESTQEVDAELYEQLLPLLLISKDENIARDLLSETYASEDGSHFDYLVGCAKYIEGRYYSAKEAFLESGYGDYQERAEMCVQPWPQNGELWHNSNYYSQSMYLTFNINTEYNSEGRYILVYTQDDVPVSALFVTGSGSVSTSLPGGVYRIREAMGYEWYGLKDAFGRDGQYEYMTFYEYSEDSTLTYLEAGYEWVISVNAVDVTGGTGVGTYSGSWDSWIMQ